MRRMNMWRIVSIGWTVAGGLTIFGAMNGCGRPDSASRIEVPGAPSEDAAAPAGEDGLAQGTPAGAALAGGWQVLAPTGEGFSVEVPALPERQAQEIKGAQGHQVELVQYQVSRDDAVFIVGASPLIAQLAEHGDKNLALDRSLASQTDQPGRTVRYKKAIALGDAVGREAELDTAVEGQAVRLRIRLYLQGARMYQALAIWPVTDLEAPPADVERFYASYKLTGDVPVDTPKVDLWQRFAVAELALDVELPHKPEFGSAEDGNFLGGTTVATMSAMTSFPPSMYTIEAIPVPRELAKQDDPALLDMWKQSVAAALAKGGARKLTRDEKAEVLGLRGRLLVTSLAAENSTTEGYQLGLVDRSKPEAPRVLVASMWALDPSAGEAEAKRFFAGIRRAAP